MVLCGDFNINNVQQMPAESAKFCKSSAFLHPHEAYDPYKRLSDAGFISSQEHALKQGAALDTCWNAACVDFNGYKGPGLRPLAVGVVDPTVDGFVLSDHRWSVAVYSEPSGAKDGAGEPLCAVVRATPDAALVEKLRTKSYLRLVLPPFEV